MNHSDKIEKYDGDLKSLAYDIGDLKYDALSEFLFALSYKIKWDSYADANRRREQLSNILLNCANNIKIASCNIKNAWDICEKHMEKNND